MKVLIPLVCTVLLLLNGVCAQSINRLMSSSGSLRSDLNLPFIEQKHQTFIASTAKEEFWSAPSFKHIDLPISTYLSDRIEYPELAKAYGIEGNTLLKLSLAADGTIVSVEFSNKLHHLLEREVRRVLKILPGIKPAYVAGHPIASLVIVPVRFSLQ